MKRPYIKFTGNYSQLKHMGYTFQKLYASNYMQWENDGFRVWKRGAELTIDRLTNYEGSFLELILSYRNSGKKIETTESRFSNSAYLTILQNNKDYSVKIWDDSAKEKYLKQEKELTGWYEKVKEVMPEEESNSYWNWKQQNLEWLEEKFGKEPEHKYQRELIDLSIVLRLIKMIDQGLIELAYFEIKDS